MLKVVLGAIIGGSIVFVYLVCPDFHLDTNLSVNIVIAIATCVATAIHYDSIRKQRRDRVWDMNKSIIIDLVHALSKVIEEIEITLDNDASQKTDIVRDLNPELYRVLDEKIDNALIVYKPLIGESLTNKLSKYKKDSCNITAQVFEEQFDIIEAYEKLLVSSKELYVSMLGLIEKLSGVNRL
ncbi:hypothetical protein [Desulfoluna butyratoxydans]|uniref:Uncharacterized protein n=1 Tax=Desulfoluna butyratoxydans TaxID=231438 RepID=A0A4U8YSM2_9BACT|nr:hypothetical protein [Desulfoluna butyratoxydans]VFQ47385.1 hypothetical protein MSL71_50850 [Desulfoluna butyratoxydans]